MIIYATSFNINDLENPGVSMDSGFTSIEQVLEVMGNPDQPRLASQLLVYGKHDDRVIFSRVPFRIDDNANSAYL